jgi:long-chain fatty acid transport protein
MRTFVKILSMWGVLLPASVSANPLDMYGFSSRSSALAGAVSADVHDTSAVYYNPAGLTRLPGLRIDLGYFYAQPFLNFNGQDTGVAASHGVTGGIATPGRVFGLPFGFGIAFHIPDDRLSQNRALPQSQPRWELYDVRLQRLYIAAMVAISPVRWLRIGGGIAFMAATRGTVDITGNISAINPSDTSLTHSVDVDLSSVRYPQVGVQADLGRGVTLGFTWRDSFNLDLTINLALRGRIFAGAIDDPNSIVIPGTYQLATHTLAAFQPQQWVLGGAWVINPRWRVMLDVTWSRWSAYPNPTAELRTSLDLVVPPALSSTLRVPAMQPSAVREPMRFHDTAITRIAGEYTAPVGRHSVSARMGYAYDPSPVPEQPGVTNFADSDRHIVTLGAGLRLHNLGTVLPGSLLIDVHTAMQFVPTRTFAKTSPIDPVGSYTAGGFVASAGITMGVQFE